ncbi:MAG: carboxypeptidase-like regulatory domain-containing protein [Candidatus Sumerlaeota bacterium]|nr:carboxypeptidase-like regulatory domain-containing protein [Candidatus Sumerlaeota bacterium]
MVDRTETAPRGTANTRTRVLAAGTIVIALIAAILIGYGWLKNRASDGARSASSQKNQTQGNSSIADMTSTSATERLAADARIKDFRKSFAPGDDEAANAAAVRAGFRKQLKVRVVWRDTGEGVPGTTVTVVEGHREAGRVGGAARTDAKGLAVVTFPASWYEMIFIKAAGPGIAADSQEMLHLPASETLLRVWRAGSIYGHVLREDKQPATGAAVRIVSPQLEPGEESYPQNKVKDAPPGATAGEDGAYEITGLRPGQYPVAAYLGALISDHDGGRPIMIEVKEGQRGGPLDIVLYPGLALNGVVRDQATGKPISGAEIARCLDWNSERKSDNAVRSGEDGAWQLEGLPRGRAMIHAAAKGYVARKAAIAMTAGAKNTCDIALMPGASVSVQVRDETSAPVAGASVILYTGDFYFPKISKEMKSDENGRAFAEGLSAWSAIKARAEKNGYEMPPGEITAIFPPGSRAAELTITLRPMAPRKVADTVTTRAQETIVFEGCVTDAAGAPIAGAEIYYGEQYTLSDGKPAISGTDGMYRFEQPKEKPQYASAQYVLAAFAKTYATAVEARSQPGSPGSPARVNFKMEKGHWASAIVVNGKGEPIEGLKIRMETIGELSVNTLAFVRADEREKRTDAEGKVRFEDLPNRAIHISILGAGWAQTQYKELPPDRETKLVIATGGVIKGRVIDAETQAPLTSFNVKCRFNTFSRDEGKEDTQFGGASGEFAIHDLLKDQKYSILVTAPEYGIQKMDDLQPADESESKPIEIKMSKRVAIKGMVFDAADQKPIAGALVMLYADELIAWGAPLDGMRALTAADGSFEISDGGKPGSLHVHFTGYVDFQIAMSERKSYESGGLLRIGLKRGGGISGTVSFKGVAPDSGRVSGSWNVPEGATQYSSDLVPLDSMGCFRFSGMRAGSYTIRAEGRYATTQFNKTVKCVLGDNEEKTVDISAGEGSAVLYGHVLKGHAPQYGARIWITKKSGRGNGNFHTETNEQGEYRIEGLSEAKHSVTVTLARDYSGKSNISETVDVRGETARDFMIPGNHLVTVKIVFDGAEGASRLPILTGGCLIRISHAGPDSTEQDGLKLDSNSGSYDVKENQMFFEGRFQGDYLLLICGNSAQGRSFQFYYPESLNLDNLTDDQDLGEILVALGSSLKGLVLDAAGKPIPYARISLRRDNSSPDYQRIPAGDSNDEGRYEVIGLSDGSYIASIQATTGENSRSKLISEPVEIKGETTRDFIIEKSFRVTARLALPEKETRFRLSDITRAILYKKDAAENGDETAGDPLQIQSFAYTDDIRDGKVAFTGRLMGKYTLSVSMGRNDERSLALPNAISLDNLDHDQDLGVLVLPTMGSLQVKITKTGDASQLGGRIRVFMLKGLEPPAQDLISRMAFTNLISLDAPEQTLSSVPEGDFLVGVTGADERALKAEPVLIPVTVKAGEPCAVSFTIQPQTALQGTIVLPQDSPRGALARSITLAGPDGVRTLTPKKARSMMYAESLLGRDAAAGGEFIFQNLTAGTWRLTVEADGCEPFTKDIEIKPENSGDTIRAQALLKRRKN